MKKVKVTDYLKASKDPAATLDCFVRFKINRLDDGKLVLIRNKMNESGDFGSLSSSLILSKSGRIVKTQEKIAGVATFDDIEQMLNNCYVSLDVFPFVFNLSNSISSYNFSSSANWKLAIQSLKVIRNASEENAKHF